MDSGDFTTKEVCEKRRNTIKVRNTDGKPFGQKVY